MKAHAFYLAVFILTLAVLALLAPNNMITGYSVCEGCAELCSEASECSEGLVCCPTMWESGVCHKASNCGAVADISARQDYESYKNPEPPQAIQNIAWKTFAVPLLVVAAIIVLYVGRKHR